MISHTRYKTNDFGCVLCKVRSVATLAFKQKFTLSFIFLHFKAILSLHFVSESRVVLQLKEQARSFWKRVRPETRDLKLLQVYCCKCLLSLLCLLHHCQRTLMESCGLASDLSVTRPGWWRQHREQPVFKRRKEKGWSDRKIYI